MTSRTSTFSQWHLYTSFTPSHLHILPSSHLHIYLPCHTLPPHTLTPAHIPTIHILPSSHPHTCTHTYNSSSHPHTCMYTNIPTMPHPHTCTYTPTPLTELGVSDKSPAEADSDKSDVEEAEDVCPICLNELDEGEDLLVCSGCHNHLHQHCMDICEW